jgi:hypothetical protein
MTHTLVLLQRCQVVPRICSLSQTAQQAEAGLAIHHVSHLHQLHQLLLDVSQCHAFVCRCRRLRLLQHRL